MAYDFRHRLHFYKNGTEYSTGLCTFRGDISGSYQFVLGVRANGTTYYAPIETSDVNQLPLVIGNYAPNSYHLVQNRMTINVQNRLQKSSTNRYSWIVTASCTKDRTEDLNISVSIFNVTSPSPMYSKNLNLPTTVSSVTGGSSSVNLTSGSNIYYVVATVTGYGQTWQTGHVQLDIPSSGTRTTNSNVVLK